MEHVPAQEVFDTISVGKAINYAFIYLSLYRNGGVGYLGIPDYCMHWCSWDCISMRERTLCFLGTEHFSKSFVIFDKY